MRKILLFSMLIWFFSVNANADGERLLDSSNALQNIIQSKNIPKALVDKSVAMIVFPDVHQAGFLLGGLMGDGIVVQKSEFGWNKPLHASIRGGSLGLQLGYQKSDMVLFVLNSKVISDMMSKKITLGADATITAWNYGENYTDLTDFKFTSDIYVFASNKGFFAGVSFSGGVIEIVPKAVSSTTYALQRWQGVLDKLYSK